MKLSEVQKALMRSIHDQDYPYSWWACYPTERRTADALERKGLLECSINPDTAHTLFNVRLTEKGREVSEALTKRTRETT